MKDDQIKTITDLLVLYFLTSGTSSADFLLGAISLDLTCNLHLCDYGSYFYGVTLWAPQPPSSTAIVCTLTFLLYILMTWDFFYFKEDILSYKLIPKSMY